jgi:U3 small nucleolar RNA-associated protein 12
MDGKYLAVSLLNFTIQIFYADTLKVFLTLYGHKLPCDTIDVSSDSTLLVSGSYDKTIKLWGLDFGNIQRSWHAHENDITQVF